MGKLMGTHILSGEYDRTGKGACFINAVIKTAFGPLLDSKEEAEQFLRWLERERCLDPRGVDDFTLELLLDAFRHAKEN